MRIVYLPIVEYLLTCIAIKFVLFSDVVVGKMVHAVNNLWYEMCTIVMI